MMGQLLPLLAARCYPVSPACPTTGTPANLPAGGVAANGHINPLGMLQPSISGLTDKLPEIVAMGLTVGVGIFVLSAGWRLIKHFVGDGDSGATHDDGHDAAWRRAEARGDRM